MSELDADILLGALKRAADWRIDDNDWIVNGEKWQDDFGDWWANGSEGDVITLEELGNFVVVEFVTGMNTGSTDEYAGDYTEWDNWIVLEQNGRFFKLDGSSDSWDSKGWHETVEEVEKIPKTIYVWETKHDY